MFSGRLRWRGVQPGRNVSRVADSGGDVRGFGGGYNNIGVPTTNIPEDVREKALTMNFYQGVGVLESLIADAQRSGETRVVTPFTPELAAMTPVLQGYQTMAMGLEVPVASVSGILDAVRNRALEFALEIEAENPQAGEATPGDDPPVPIARTDIIFNTTIYGPERHRPRRHRPRDPGRPCESDGLPRGARGIRRRPHRVAGRPSRPTTAASGRG